MRAVRANSNFECKKCSVDRTVQVGRVVPRTLQADPRELGRVKCEIERRTLSVADPVGVERIVVRARYQIVTGSRGPALGEAPEELRVKPGILENPDRRVTAASERLRLERDD